jgi:hypothetical protein
MNNKSVLITKASGIREPFDIKKLRYSLSTAGAPGDLIDEISNHLESEIKEGMSTHDIYRHAFSLLRSKAHHVAVRYSLRRAVGELGPTGFPFERYIAELFRAKGFSADTNQIGKGKCVEHEIDVVAWNEEKVTMVEAKFHNEPGLKSDVKVALYVKARFDDLVGQKIVLDGKERQFSEGVLLTNTKFSERAIEYANCAGLKLIGWNYPHEHNLHNMIEDFKLHPVTGLSTLSNTDKQNLLREGIVLCRSVNHSVLSRQGIRGDKAKEVLGELNVVCPVE